MEDTKYIKSQGDNRPDIERMVLLAALKQSLDKGDLEGVNLCHKQLFLTMMDGNSLNTIPVVHNTDSKSIITTQVASQADITIVQNSLRNDNKFNQSDIEFPQYLKDFENKTTLFNKDKAYQNLYKLLSVTSFASFSDLKQNYWLLIKGIMSFKQGFLNENNWKNSLQFLNIAHDILRIPKLRAQHDLIAQNLPVVNDFPVVKTSLTKIPKITRKLKIGLEELLVKSGLIDNTVLDKVIRENHYDTNQGLGIILVQDGHLNAQELNVVLKCLKLLNIKAIKLETAIEAIKQFQETNTSVDDFLLKNNLIKENVVKQKSVDSQAQKPDSLFNSIDATLKTDLTLISYFNENQPSTGDEELIIDFSTDDESITGIQGSDIAVEAIVHTETVDRVIVSESELSDNTETVDRVIVSESELSDNTETDNVTKDSLIEMLNVELSNLPESTKPDQVKAQEQISKNKFKKKKKKKKH